MAHELEVDQRLVDAFVTASRALVGIAVRSIASAPAPVTVSQHRVMVLLAAEGDLSVGQIAELSGVNQSNASRLCDRLQKLGLVARSRAAEDGRLVRVSLTEAGQQLLEVVTEQRRREVAAVLGRMPEPAVTDAMAALQQFNDAAHERDDRSWAFHAW